MTHLCTLHPKGLGGRACGAELVPIGHDRAGVLLYVCRECRLVYEARTPPPSFYWTLAGKVRTP